MSANFFEPPKLSVLVPLEILDDAEGLRVFGLRSDVGQLFLAYMCAKNAEAERFLLVPTTTETLRDIADNLVSLRDALTQPAQRWIIDRNANGVLSSAKPVDVLELPDNALPHADSRLDFLINDR